MRRERIGQPVMRRQLRAIQGRSQYPHRHLGPFPGKGAHSRRAVAVFHVVDQLGHILRETVLGRHVPAQGAGGGHVGARRTAQPQINPVGIQRSQRAELFGHHQRRVVGQHDAARAHTYTFRGPRNMADDHGGGGAGDAGHVVMLCQPIAVITSRLGRLCQLDGIGQRIRSSGPFGHGRQVKKREMLHIR